MATGDPAAFQQFVTTALPTIISMLRGVFKRHGVTEGNIDDLVQDTLLKAIKVLRTDKSKTVNASWLFMVARSTLLDSVRKAERSSVIREPSVVEECIDRNAGERDRKTEDSEYIIDLIEKLTCKDKDIIISIYMNGNTIERTAVLLGIGVEAAYKRHARALQRLRRLAIGK